MKLDDVIFPAMTVRQFLQKMFDDDWNNCKLALESVPEQNFCGSLLLQANIDVELAKEVAKEVLKDMQAK